MGYILKRDLPFRKAGAEIFIENNELRVYNGDATKVFIGWEDFLDDYVREGWIVEIPHELYISYDNKIEELQGYVSHNLKKITKFAKPTDKIFRIKIEEEIKII